MSFGVIKTPAIPPATPAKTQPIVLIGPTRIPANRAISGWKAAARSDNPRSVFWKIKEKIIMTIAEPTITKTLRRENGRASPPITKPFVETGG